MKKRLLIISDGNGVDSGSNRRWPTLLKLLLNQTHEVVNHSIAGASNETILFKLAETLGEQTFDQAIIQWNGYRRVDLVINDFLQPHVSREEKYNRTTSINGKDIWVTSGCKNSLISQYHSMIDNWHTKQRNQAFFLSAANILQQARVDFYFTLGYSFDFEPPLNSFVDQLPWLWHEHHLGLDNFRQISEFKDLDLNLPQPHTLVHLDWIQSVLLPQCSFIDYSPQTFYNIKQALLKQCSK